LSSGAAPAGDAFMQFEPSAAACGCWTGPITLEIDGRAGGGMSCSTPAGPFPVAAGAHSYRACDVLGCVSSNVNVSTNATLTVTLTCQ
jgi:hypothetical protein